MGWYGRKGRTLLVSVLRLANQMDRGVSYEQVTRNERFKLARQPPEVGTRDLNSTAATEERDPSRRVT
jgi:hypothetical protein